MNPADPQAPTMAVPAPGPERSSAMIFLKNLKLESSDSSSDSDAADAAATLALSVAASKKNKRVESVPPRSSTPEKAERPESDGEPSAPKRERRVSRRPSVKTEKPARATRKKAPASKKSRAGIKSETKTEALASETGKDEGRVKATDHDEAKQEEPTTTTRRPARRRERPAARGAAAKSEATASRKVARPVKARGDKAVEPRGDEAQALVTPSPGRKRARVVSSVPPADHGEEEDENQKQKKALQLKRMNKLRTRRGNQKELKDDRMERDRLLDAEDAENEAATGDDDNERRSREKFLKRRLRHDDAASQRDETRKLEHRKRRRLSDMQELTTDRSDVANPAEDVTMETKDEVAGAGGDNAVAGEDGVKNEQSVTPTGRSNGKAATPDVKTTIEKDSGQERSESSVANEKAAELKATTGDCTVLESVAKPATPVPEPGEIEDGQIEVATEGTEDAEAKQVQVVDVKATDDLPIPKKKLPPQLTNLDNLPIPKKAPVSTDSHGTAAAFIIPKRPMASMVIVANETVSKVNGVIPVVVSGRLSSSIPLKQPGLTTGSSMVNRSEAAIPPRRRTKQQVPSEREKTVTKEETDFTKLARKRGSFFAACIPLEQFQKGPTPYEVFDAGCKPLPDLVPRLNCPTRRDLASNRDDFPAAYFGVGLTPPTASIGEKRTINGTEAGEVGEVTAAAVNCYEPLKFSRIDDREIYQRKMYGTTFTPHVIKGRTTLLVRNALYERKSRGIRFNADRDRDDFAQVLSQRFTMNKSVPRCEITRDQWKKMMGQKPGLVYLHYSNREDATLAAASFVDDVGVPLEMKREYRAGVVLTRSPSPAVGPGAPRRSRSRDRPTPAPSPEGQYGSDREFRIGRDIRREQERDRFRGRLGDEFARHSPRPSPGGMRPSPGGMRPSPSTMRPSPSGSGRELRTSFTTPINTGRGNHWTGGHDRWRDERNDHPSTSDSASGRDRLERPPRSRSRSRPRSRSRSHSLHAALDAARTIDSSGAVAGPFDERSQGVGSKDAASGTNDSLVSTDVATSSTGAKSTATDSDGNVEHPKISQVAGNSTGKTESTATEVKPEDVPNAEQKNSAGAVEPSEQATRERTASASPVKWRTPDGGNGSQSSHPSHRADEYSGERHRSGSADRNSRRDGDRLPMYDDRWRRDRSRSRSRPRNPDFRSDWERGNPRDRSYHDFDGNRSGPRYPGGNHCGGPPMGRYGPGTGGSPNERERFPPPEERRHRGGRSRW